MVNTDLKSVPMLTYKKSHLLPTAFVWSERRDSNSRPRPWQGRALPTELLSHNFLVVQI